MVYMKYPKITKFTNGNLGNNTKLFLRGNEDQDGEKSPSPDSPSKIKFLSTSDLNDKGTF